MGAVAEWWWWSGGGGGGGCGCTFGHCMGALKLREGGWLRKGETNAPIPRSLGRGSVVGCVLRRELGARQVRAALEALRADADPDVQHFARLALDALA